MKFNKNKSVVIIHRKENRYKDLRIIHGIKRVKDTKVLGFQFNNHTNCESHMTKIKGKLEKVKKMMYISKKNQLGRW